MSITVIETTPFLDKRALNSWNKSNQTLAFQLELIKTKTENGRPPIKLDFIDLVLISNFKGGNATIAYDQYLDKKLEHYSSLFNSIQTQFGRYSLSNITDDKFENLKVSIKEVISSCYMDEFKIDGFKASFMSALLNVYFPNLIPILDRRLLLNLNLINSTHLDKYFQVKDIQQHYRELLDCVRELTKKTNKTVREIDKEYFIKPLPEWAKNKKTSLKILN